MREDFKIQVRDGKITLGKLNKYLTITRDIVVLISITKKWRIYTMHVSHQDLTLVLIIRKDY